MPGDEGSSGFVLGVRGMAWWGVEWVQQQACSQSRVSLLWPKAAKHTQPVFFQNSIQDFSRALPLHSQALPHCPTHCTFLRGQV